MKKRQNLYVEKETVDEAYTDKLFDDVTALYHLNDTLQSTAGKQDLGPLPTTSVVLLSVIGAAWVLILLYVVWQQLQKSKKRGLIFRTFRL